MMHVVVVSMHGDACYSCCGGERLSRIISKLFMFADKHTPAEFVTKLDELGTKEAIVLGGLCTVPETVRAHFAVMALLDADEDQTLAACVEEKRATIKAVNDGGEQAVRHAAFLAALESFVLHLDPEDGCREANVGAFDKTLRVCWERSLVEEDALRKWVEDERAAHYLQVRANDAIRLRVRGQRFIEWVDSGED